MTVSLSLGQEDLACPAQGQQQEDYPTRATYRWALRNLKRSHGGSLILLLALAVFFGAWTDSQALLWALVAFAVVVWLVARSRP